MTGEAEPSDAVLLAAHVDGDAGALAVLVRRHTPRLWPVALRTCGDAQEAEDALQDAWLSVARRAGTFRGDAQVSTWLHRVVVNACLDRLRARRRAPVPTADDVLRPAVDAAARPGSTAGPEESAVASERRARLERALADLPDEQRVALVLVDVAGLRLEEASAVLGVPQGTLKSRRSRARAELADALREMTDEAGAGAVAGAVRGNRHRPRDVGAPGGTGARGAHARGGDR